jgi:hypothetical protein
MNIIKIKLKIIFSLINNSLGEKNFKVKRKIVVIIIVTIAERVKQVLIFWFFISEFGRYLIIPEPSPRRLKLVIRDITDRIVVASPICSAVNNLVVIIQKTSPRIDRINVLVIKYKEFL